MKVKIKCPSCRSENVRIISNAGDTTPMYKCIGCGYERNLFPQLQKKTEDMEEEEEI